MIQYQRGKKTVALTFAGDFANNSCICIHRESDVGPVLGSWKSTVHLGKCSTDIFILYWIHHLCLFFTAICRCTSSSILSHNFFVQCLRSDCCHYWHLLLIFLTYVVRTSWNLQELCWVGTIKPSEVCWSLYNNLGSFIAFDQTGTASVLTSDAHWRILSLISVLHYKSYHRDNVH